ncbi:ANTAR domain-containing protein [Nocardioides anomalus]|uniref:ANTAR domain-containing protein n=1 Tax=Nocardioides anomalus TaxID=2712223 RepID=A0A6G6WDH0_9ACTN|nr:ANTAR domain-containing protein [Nocardioides anomalus]QIG43391.1 ANTAR domain-containing protein [Nocardioides anomalus]
MTDSTAPADTEQLRAALASRTTIGIALGILMERRSLSQDAAFAHLNQLSQATNRKIRDLAADLVAGIDLP